MDEYEIVLFQAFYFFPSSMTAAFDAQKNIPLSYITQIQAFKRKLIGKKLKRFFIFSRLNNSLIAKK